MSSSAPANYREEIPLPNQCRICTHPERQKIEDLILNKTSLRDIAGHYPGISKSSLSRHKKHIPHQKNPGRPCKLTPDVQKRLHDALRAGIYIEYAVTYVGISKSTYYSWMAKGDADDAAGLTTEFSDFSHSIKRADAECKVRLLLLWQKQMPKNWKACATFLERRWPEDWGRYRRVDQNRINDTRQDIRITNDTGAGTENIKDTVSLYAEAFRAVWEEILAQDTVLVEDDSLLDTPSLTKSTNPMRPPCVHQIIKSGETLVVTKFLTTYPALHLKSCRYGTLGAKPEVSHN